jgi:UDP-N-acetylmuramate dehydrogenase
MEALEAYDLQTGEKKYFRNSACAFGYRDSIFKNELKGRYLITNVIFRLNKQAVFNLTYEPLRKKLLESGKKELTASDISAAVKEIRSEKLPDPAITGNAGSFFKNPVIEKSQWDNLKGRHSSLPGHFLDENHVKIPAAWLIEQCGWKGRRSGRAGVHTRQPLVLINTGGATGLEILRLSEAIRFSVKENFGINLIPEVRIR